MSFQTLTLRDMLLKLNSLLVTVDRIDPSHPQPRPRQLQSRVPTLLRLSEQQTQDEEENGDDFLKQTRSSSSSFNNNYFRSCSSMIHPGSVSLLHFKTDDCRMIRNSELWMRIKSKIWWSEWDAKMCLVSSSGVDNDGKSIYHSEFPDKIITCFWLLVLQGLQYGKNDFHWQEEKKFFDSMGSHFEEFNLMMVTGLQFSFVEEPESYLNFPIKI